MDLGLGFRDLGLNNLSQAWFDAESYKFRRMYWFGQDVAMDPPLEHEAPLDLPADQLPVHPVLIPQQPQHHEPEQPDATEDCRFKVWVQCLGFSVLMVLV